MAFEVTGTGSSSFAAVEGWGWGQLSTDTYTNYGWGTPAFAKAVQGFGHNSPVSSIPEFTLTGFGQVITQGGTFAAPAVTTTGYGGGTQNDATLTLSATIAGTSLHLGRMTSARVPRFTLTGVARTEQIGGASVRFTRFSLSGYGAANASLTFPTFTVNTAGQVEGRGTLVDASRCDFIRLFPCGMWSLTASGTAIPQGQMSGDLPAFSLTTTIPASLEIPHFWIDAEAA